MNTTIQQTNDGKRSEGGMIMYELYVLNELGQEVYHLSGATELDETIGSGKSCLKDMADAKSAYVIETVMTTQMASCFFHTRHLWFGTREELSE